MTNPPTSHTTSPPLAPDCYNPTNPQTEQTADDCSWAVTVEL